MELISIEISPNVMKTLPHKNSYYNKVEFQYPSTLQSTKMISAVKYGQE